MTRKISGTLGAAALLAAWLLWPSLAAAADLQAAATALAQEALSGHRGGGFPPPQRLLLVPFRGEPGDVAQLFTQRLSGALREEYGLELASGANLSGAVTAADGALTVPPAWLDAAGKEGAQALLAGTLSCGPQICTATAVLYDVSSRQPTSTTAVELDVPSADSLAEGLQDDTDGSGLRRLVDRLATGLHRIEGDGRGGRFAVAPLAEQGQGGDGQLGALLASEIGRRLTREHQISLVDLDKVKEALAALHARPTDLDRRLTLTLNAQLGTQGVVVGSVARSEGQYLVSAQVIAGRDGEVILGEEAVLPPAEVAKLAARAGQVPDRYGAFKRSLVPGWGQFYADHVAEGMIFSVGEAALLAAAVFFELQYNASWDKYSSLPSGTTQAALDSQFDVALSDYHKRNWMLGLAAGLYVANIIDALLIEPDLQL
ncbi:MAG TPA: FlgO family outer membrane protein [Myxococcota bacterium]|nr:FlgO family outer membrane protein [Myxococcota bacterium]